MRERESGGRERGRGGDREGDSRPSSGVLVSGRRSRHRETKLRAGAREWLRMLSE